MPARPKPKALKILTGTFRRDRHPGDVPTPPPANPRMMPPKSLGKAGKAAWKRLYPGLCECGIMSILDVPAFEMYCQTYDHLEYHAEVLNREGRYLVLPNGSRKLHPAATEELRWSAFQRDLGRDFGLTHSSRQNLRIADTPEPQTPGVASRKRGVPSWPQARDGDDLDEFLAGTEGA